MTHKVKKESGTFIDKKGQERLTEEHKRKVTEFIETLARKHGVDPYAKGGSK